MRFLRTASTTRLLATIAGVIAAVAAGTAIAVAATSSNPVPKPEPLAQAVHSALSATHPSGISADINFTNNLISSSDFTGGPHDPLLQGATGRLWISGKQTRVELQTSNGDAELLVNGRSFWLSDPATHTVYQGTIPQDRTSSTSGSSSSSTTTSSTDTVPSISQIQTKIDNLMTHADLSGAATSNPTDINGLGAYSVSVSPKHSGGLLGSLQLAWDALRGVPLQFSVYAHGGSTPVLQLTLSNVNYGAIPSADFAIQPPSDYTKVAVATSQSQTSGSGSSKPVQGLSAVQAKVPFTVAAPSSVAGLTLNQVTLLNWGSHPAALVTYGQGLGAIAVIEQSASGAHPLGGSGAQNQSGLALPSVAVNGSTGQELDTALGTLIRVTHRGVAYTVIGSVTPPAAEQAARAIVP
ncbi:MAG: hypothetical protein ACYCXW_22650 [Solirubrobacteraceae bacterium]